MREDTGPTIADLVWAFRSEMKSRRGGGCTYGGIALDALTNLYGDMPVEKFTGRDLRTCFVALVKSGKFPVYHQ